MTSERPETASVRETGIALVAAVLGFAGMGVVGTLAGLSTGWSALVLVCGVVAVVPALVLVASRRRRRPGPVESS